MFNKSWQCCTWKIWLAERDIQSVFEGLCAFNHYCSSIIESAGQSLEIFLPGGRGGHAQQVQEGLRYRLDPSWRVAQTRSRCWALGSSSLLAMFLTKQWNTI